ncbi:hypothetical protein Tco_1008762 [Tanacetum coccineum]
MVTRLLTKVGKLLRSIDWKNNLTNVIYTLPQAEICIQPCRLNCTTRSDTPFEIVYGRNPITPLDLVLIPVREPLNIDTDEQSKKIKDFHQQEWFPAGRFGKLKPRADGPFRVEKNFNDNAYKIELPIHYNVSATFNVSDLSPYSGESEGEEDSWMSLSQAGENDAGEEILSYMLNP